MARLCSLLLFILIVPSTSSAVSDDDRRESKSGDRVPIVENERVERRRVSEAFIDALNIKEDHESYHERAFYVNLCDRIKDVEFDPAPNILFIIADQLRYDALGFIQSRMAEYDGKLKVKTPNIDRIAASGVSFETAYCVSPSCGPSRASIKTGASLQRTGILQNNLFSKKMYERMDIFESRVRRLETFEQVLVENKGYTNEYYGKYHAPLLWFRGFNASHVNVIKYNEYDYQNNTPILRPEIQIQPMYKRCLSYLLRRDAVNTEIHSGQQVNDNSGYPYDPIRIDVRYGMPTSTPLDKSSGFDRSETGDTDISGRDSLNTSYTDTAIVGDSSIRALNRLLVTSRLTKTPFILGVSFRAPHPPNVASDPYFSYYHDQFENVRLPDSLHDPMRDSAYVDDNQRKDMDKLGDAYPYSNPSLMAEYTSVYYAMIEEIDTWVGKLLDRLDAAGATNHTLVVLTSDHGEMLGAHSMLNKGNLLEEAARVPLLLSYPGVIPPGKVIPASTPVSHLDLFATLLDYTYASEHDNSDGSSLRRFIENRSFNELYDERTVVVEIDFRFPVNRHRLNEGLGERPNFMIRKGSYKLMLPKNRASVVIDMMYDLKSDPSEMTNLLSARNYQSSDGTDVPDAVVGKAEHLKILLVESLRRLDGGDQRYYSSNKWNLGEGAGDIAEIRNRRTWRSAEYWQSDAELSFGPPVEVNGTYVRNEYIYVGRTAEGSMDVTGISVSGPDAEYFALNVTASPGGGSPLGTISQGEYVRARISFRSKERLSISSLSAVIVIRNSVNGESKISIVGEE